jgi:phospholipid/cholesterol/gamma-HCH transport system substrate-binding protein
MARNQKSLGLSQLRVGIFVLFGLLVMAYLIMNASGDFNPFEKKLRIKARFAAADGLRAGSEVQLAGVNIGKVEQVVLLPPESPEDFKIEAIMAISRELYGRPITERIRTDSTAQLVATSVLANDKLINISPGSQKGSPVSENDILESKEAISINQLTATGNELLQQINRLATPTNEILNKANQGEGTLGQIINNDQLYQSLDSTIGEAKLTMLKLQNTLDGVNKGEGTAGKLVRDPALYESLNKTVSQLEAISVDLRQGKGTAGKFITDEALYTETRAAIADLRTSVGKINSIADDFKAITTDLREGRGTAGKLLKDDKLYDDVQSTLGKFSSTAEQLDALLADARAGKGTIGRLVTDETLYNNMNQTMSNVNQFSSESTKLLYDFRQNPRKFLTIKFKLF